MLCPTVRSSVLLPDMFDPLTSRTRSSPPRRTSLRTHVRGGDQRMADGPRRRSRSRSVSISGNGSSGSRRRRRRGRRAPRTRPTAASQPAIAGPSWPRQASMASASWVVQSMSARERGEELVVLRVEQVQEPGEPGDPPRGGLPLGPRADSRSASGSGELKRLALEPGEQARRGGRGRASAARSRREPCGPASR